VAGRNHQVEIWRLDTEQIEFSYDCEYPAYQVKFHPVGQTLAISTSDGAVRFWDFQMGQLHARVSKKGNRSRTTIAYSADGTRFVTASEQDAVRLWDLEHERQLLTLAEGGDVAGLVSFSPCGRYIAAVCANDIRVWKGGTGITATLENATNEH
jgi:WD40 repeat protein